MDAALDFNFDDLNKGRSYESPLTLAIHRNLLEIAKLLLDGGASVNRPDGSGRAAIHGTRSADTVKTARLARCGHQPRGPHGTHTADHCGRERRCASSGRAAGERRSPRRSGQERDLLARVIEWRKPEMFDLLLARGVNPRNPPTRAMWQLIESGDAERARALLRRARIRTRVANASG